MKQQTWCVAIASGQHVVPLNDSRAHELDLTCGCHPRRDAIYPSVIIHNAFDRREVIEEVEKLIAIKANREGRR